MKKRLLLPSLFVGAALLGLPRALAEVIITLNDGHIIRVEKVENIQINEGGNGLFAVTYNDGTTESFNIADITDMSFGEKDIADPDPTPGVEPSDDPNVITIEWNGAEAPAIHCSAPGVSVTREGGNVFVTNTNTDTEYTYVLRGQSTDGSLTLTADYKSTIQLDGLSLQSGLEEALNIKCGKRIALVVGNGTVNSLADATADNGQKGALYCKGHLEMEGGGTLNLTGNVKHALSTKEYLQLKKKFTGELNVLAAANDGIHAGQYFQMNNGNVTISGVKGDGIQAEITTDPEDEQNGQMIIKGGNINITLAGDDVVALKADSLMSIIDGTISITTTGADGKGIKTDTDIIVGNKDTGTGPILSVVTKGGRLAEDGTTGGNTGGTGGGGWWGGGRPGGGGWGPGGGESSSGSSSKAIKAEGTYTQYGGNLYINTANAEGIESKNNSATSMNFNGGTVYLYCSDDCINSAGAINFNGAHVMAISFNNDAIDSNYGKAGSLVITDGTVIAFSTRGGAEMGFDADANSRVTFKGGSLIAGGGNQGGGSSSLGTGSIHYKVWSANISYTVGNYYSVTQGGTGIFTFCLPVNCNSTYNFYACSDFKSNTSHSIVRNSTAPTDGTPVLFRTSADDLVGKPLFWRPTDVTSGTSVTTFSPN